MSYSLEVVFEIWNDKTGERITIGNDRDGLSLIEIRSITDDGSTAGSIMLTEEQAPMFIEAFQRFMDVKKK